MDDSNHPLMATSLTKPLVSERPLLVEEGDVRGVWQGVLGRKAGRGHFSTEKVGLVLPLPYWCMSLIHEDIGGGRRVFMVRGRLLKGKQRRQVEDVYRGCWRDLQVCRVIVGHYGRLEWLHSTTLNVKQRCLTRNNFQNLCELRRNT